MAPFAGKVKRALGHFTPSPLHRLVREYLSRRWDAKYEDRPVEEIFSAIYRDHRWGSQSDGDLSSGCGSSDPVVVLPYVNAVEKFLLSWPHPPSVVDLGCGDFNVGKQLRAYCGRYIACDVVPALIDRNKNEFAGMHVDFRRIDIINDDLPDGDIVFIRQVLQHLSNAQIMRVVRKLYCYKFLVLTEHVPIDPSFPANRDKATSGGTRLPHGSGVVLTAPPFMFTVKSESVICTRNQSLGQHDGLVKTTLYEPDSVRPTQEVVK